MNSEYESMDGLTKDFQGIEAPRRAKEADMFTTMLVSVG